jgi:ribulose-5-phosphate 4-epimerase/fuculose-1-phosphate aldolase
MPGLSRGNAPAGIAAAGPGQADTSADEWAVRCDLAALYRVTALEEWDDLLLTHISARVPGEHEHFLINPFGLRFAEVTASSLVKVDMSGNILSAHACRINYAGFVIHSAIHRARADARFIIHLHSDDGVAIASQREGLLPLNQRAMQVIRSLSYHDYEGVAVDLAEQVRIVADLGSASTMILRNHGTLALGSSAGQAWMNIYALEKACITQIKALSAGRDGVLPAPTAAQEKLLRPVDPAQRAENARLAWESLSRRLQAESPGFDT